MKKPGSSTAPYTQMFPSPPAIFIALPAPALTSAIVARLHAAPEADEPKAAIPDAVAASAAAFASPEAAAAAPLTAAAAWPPRSIPQLSFTYAVRRCSAATTFGDENAVMSAAVSLL